MRPSITASHVLSALTTVTMLGGCASAGSQLALSSGVNAAAVPSVAAAARVSASNPVTGGTYLHADAKKVQLIYVATGASSGTVNIYPLAGKNQKQVGQITGLTNPGGLSIDHTGDLYVANEGANNVLEFSSGTKPKLVATLDDSGQYPVGLSIDPKTGDIAATNFETTTFGSGSVSFYHAGALKPYKIVTALPYTYFAGYDDSGNLFVDGRTTSSPPMTEVGRIAAGSKKLTMIAISGIVFPGGVKVDKADNILIDDQTSKTINCYAGASPHRACGTTSLGGAGDPVDFALRKSGTSLYTADAYTPGLALEYRFPAGGKPVNTIVVGGYTVGVAIGPPAQPLGR